MSMREGFVTNLPKNWLYGSLKLVQWSFLSVQECSYPLLLFQCDDAPVVFNSCVRLKSLQSYFLFRPELNYSMPLGVKNQMKYKNDRNSIPYTNQHQKEDIIISINSDI